MTIDRKTLTTGGAALLTVLAAPMPQAGAQAPQAEARTPDAGLTPAERAAGWVVLFDGTSTDAWRGYRRPGLPRAGWVDRGRHACASRPAAAAGDLITKQQFENFELVARVEGLAAAANSGIMYRVTEEYDT